MTLSANTTTQQIIDTLNTKVSEATGLTFSFEHLGGNDFTGYADGAEYGLYATIPVVDGEPRYDATEEVEDYGFDDASETQPSYTVNFASDGTGLSESAFDLDTAIRQLIRALEN